MKNADTSLMMLILDEAERERDHIPSGVAIFKKGRRFGGQVVSETALHRLTKLGYVEVETHNVSAWNFGPAFPAYNYKSLHGQAAYDAEIQRIKDVEATLPKREFSTRSEIWVRVTTLGLQALRDIGALT